MSTPELDSLDRKLISATEAGLPIDVDPYTRLAEQLGECPEKVREHLRQLQERGVIRRIAAVPNHYRLGYRANGMSVWDVDDARVSELGARIARLGFVSHCYRRPRHPPIWPYNLFAMLHARVRAEVYRQAEVIEELLGPHCRAHEVLFSSAILKKTGFRSRSASTP